LHSASSSYSLRPGVTSNPVFSCSTGSGVPPAAEAPAYAQYQISEHQPGKFACRLTPPAGHGGVWRHLATGRPISYNGEWIEGAVRSSGLRFADGYIWLLRTRSRMRQQFGALRRH